MNDSRALHRTRASGDVVDRAHKYDTHDAQAKQEHRHDEQRSFDRQQIETSIQLSDSSPQSKHCAIIHEISPHASPPTLRSTLRQPLGRIEGATRRHAMTYGHPGPDHSGWLPCSATDRWLSLPACPIVPNHPQNAPNSHHQSRCSRP